MKDDGALTWWTLFLYSAFALVYSCVAGFGARIGWKAATAVLGKVRGES